MIKTALILAGGFGTRLQSIVKDVPKPMAPINGIPFLDYQLFYLKQQGISQVILSVGHLFEAIQQRYQTNFNGLEIKYAIEDSPLGTGGAIRGLTMAAFDLEKSVFIATSAFIDLGIDFSRSVVYFYNGYVHKHDLYLIPILLLVSIIGTLIGKRILNFFTQNQFKFFVLFLILVVGLITLGKLYL